MWDTSKGLRPSAKKNAPRDINGNDTLRFGFAVWDVRLLDFLEQSMKRTVVEVGVDQDVTPGSALSTGMGSANHPSTHLP